MAEHSLQTKTTRRRREYGTRSLRVIGRSWVGSWYGPDGRKVMRTVGLARTLGERDGLTKSQAEECRAMRASQAPRARVEVTMADGGQELCRRLEIRGRKKSHRMTVESDLRNHIAPFFASKELDKIVPRDIERYISAKLKVLVPKTVRNHLNNDAFRL